MALRRWTGAAWVDVQQVRRWNGSAWVKVPVKRWTGSAWVDTIQYVYTDQWAPTEWQTYWNGGSRDNQFPDEHFQGTWSGSSSDLRRDLIILPYGAIASALAGATIQAVKLRLRRESSVHGTSGEAAVFIHSHNIDSLPATWTLSGLTQRAEVGLSRGEEKWVPLPNAVGNGLRDGSIKGLAISTTLTGIGYYARLTAARTLLEITYEQ